MSLDDTHDARHAHATDAGTPWVFGNGSLDALVAVDPHALSARAQRAFLVEVQAAQARLAALGMAGLVALCGAEPRVREVQVEVAPSSEANPLDIDPEAVAAAGGRDVTDRSVSVTGARTRTVTFTDEVVDEVAALLHRTHGSVAHELRRARLLHGPLAPVRDALAAGEITAAHVGGICEQAARMQPVPTGSPDADAEHTQVFVQQCARLVERVLPVARRSTPGATRSRARQIVASIDAAAERQRRQRAKARMDVVAVAEDDGLASIIATMSALDAAALMSRIDGYAKTAMMSDAPLLTDPNASIGQHRTAAFLSLLGMSATNCANEPLASMVATHCYDRAESVTSDLTPVSTDAGHASGSPAFAVYSQARSADGASRASGPRLGPGHASSGHAPSTRVEVQVLVDARVLAGVADGSAWVQAGAGDLTAIDRDDVIALLADKTTPTTLRRLLVDPVSGALVDRGAKTYTPTSDLVAWLAARDQTCRFPGCTAKAVRCDVDHAVDFDQGGATTLTNTGLLCRRHHNRKTHAGWRIENPRPDGSCDFVAPDGTRHRRFPTTLADLMPEPPPSCDSASSSSLGTAPPNVAPPHLAAMVTAALPDGPLPITASSDQVRGAAVRQSSSHRRTSSTRTAKPCGHSASACTTTACSAPYGRTPNGEPLPF